MADRIFAFQTSENTNRSCDEIVKCLGRFGHLSVDDTLFRKRGLGIFGTGMHHDPLSSSKSKKTCHWGHDWMDLSIVIATPGWAPSKVFSLPICMRLYRNRQGLTKGKNKKPKKTTASQKKAASKKYQQAAAKKRQAKPAAEETRQGSKTPHKTRPELMAEMIDMVAAWFPDRQFLFSCWWSIAYTVARACLERCPAMLT